MKQRPAHSPSYLPPHFCPPPPPDLGDAVGSTLLRQLTTPGALFPDMDAALQDMRDATDWDEAETSGRVVPREVSRWLLGLCGIGLGCWWCRRGMRQEGQAWNVMRLSAS